MIDLTEPGMLGGKNNEQDQKWNSDALACLGMTCNEAARFMSAYITSLKTLVIAEKNGGPGGRAKELASHLLLQVRACYESGLMEQNKEHALKGLEIGILAVCAAAISADRNVWHEELLKLAASAEDGAVAVMKKLPDDFDKGEVRFQVRKHPEGGIEVGCALVSHVDLQKQMADNPFMQAVMKQDHKGDN